MHRTALFGSEGFSLQQLQPENVRFGLIVRLPFRIRVSSLTRIDPIDNEAEVWFHNRVAIPKGSHLPKILYDLRDNQDNGYAALWSQAVVLLTKPKLVDGVIDAMREGSTGNLGIGGNYFQAIQVLNEVIYGYADVTKSLFGGAPLRFLTDMDFFQGLYLEFAFLAPRDYAITAKDMQEVLDWRPDREVVALGGQLTGEMEDLDPGALSQLATSIGRFREHAFYELAFKARTAMLDREPIIALVLACAALEGAHAALLRTSLSPALGAYSKGAEGLIDSLLREQGIYTLIQLTACVFMDAGHSLTPDKLERCLGALIIRNDIVHAKQKKGMYKLRAHSFKDLSEAYSAVMDVYQIFVDAVGIRSDKAT